MKYKLIKSYSDFMLNETLKTTNIDTTIDIVDWEISLMHFENTIVKNDNKIELTLYNFNYIRGIRLSLEYFDSLFIDRHGWFPSTMKLINISDMYNNLSYNEEYLIKNQTTLNKVTIVYEPKFDLLLDVPNKMYHLTIQSYEDKILTKGLIPKSKSKLSKHLDRIYLCSDVEYCYKLITRMKVEYDYINNPHLDTKWVIFEIDMEGLDIKLYSDPNYKNKGSYVVDNIPPNRITLFDKE